MDGSSRVEEVELVSMPVTLPNFPDELLLLVIEDLDNEALLNLGHTCRRMNAIAFNHFFSANSIRDPGGGWFNPYRSPPPVETLPILRSALFVTHLRYFDFTLNTGIDRMRSEVSDIRVLAARLQTMDVFKISFPHFSPDLHNCLPMSPWYRSVTGMLDTVLEKGCTELHVSAGTRFPTLYCDHIPLQEPSELTQPEGAAIEYHFQDFCMTISNSEHQPRTERR